jgi:hypothetical protein
MTDQHPITPPPKLVLQWQADWHHSKVKHIELQDHIATQAALWGADQELEACIEWMAGRDWTWTITQLRAARRPNPPSLKEQALDELTSAERLYPADWSSIRKALEALPE